MKTDLVGLMDKTPEYVKKIVEKGIEVKKNKENYFDALHRKSLLMFFEKPSTRTRLSFEVGMTQLGGHAIYFGRDSHIASGHEDLYDTAHVISRFADLIMARVYSHSTVEGLAKYASVPVINGLSDFEHPCQALADVMTIKEKKGTNVKVAFVGDGNNVAHSLMLACAMMGMKFSIATPREYAPDERVVKRAREFGEIVLTNSPEEAVENADVVYTDVWVSMGEEKEKEKRMRDFKGFQVNSGLMGKAKSDAIFMHCLPALKGYEVTKEVVEGPQSVVFDEAENRLHVQKAIMLDCLGL